MKHNDAKNAYVRENTKHFEALVLGILDRQGHQCAYCGCPIGWDDQPSCPTFDRVDTEHDDVTYTSENTQALCVSCNGMKHAIEERKLLDMTCVSSLVKYNIRRYLAGEPRIFKEMPTCESATTSKPTGLTPPSSTASPPSTSTPGASSSSDPGRYWQRLSGSSMRLHFL